MMAYSITDACVGCTLCQKNCPVKAITGDLKKKHTINRDVCIDCGLCGKLCAASAVQNSDGVTAERLPKAQWPRPCVDGELCAGCSVCIESCPKSCLELTKPLFAGDIKTTAVLSRPDDCIGCGICADVCPIGIITMTVRQ